MRNQPEFGTDTLQYCSEISIFGHLCTPISQSFYCQGSISNTFYYSAIKDWNGLPDSIKSIKDNIKFKFEVKTF